MEKEEIQRMCGNWLMYMPEVPRKMKMNVLRKLRLPTLAYDASEKMISELLVDGKYVTAWFEYKNKSQPDILWQELRKKGINFTYYGASDYPAKLMTIQDPPVGLYYIGRLPDSQKHSVAIIGARNNSDYGRCMAEHFASRLAAGGVTIISGMAMGIDGIAQKACLASGGESYGILGSAVDVIYPANNTKLYYNLIEKGGVISEAIPGTPPHAGLFPVRNRIISGLSDVVLVVEAREKSGTLITVDLALEQSREVYVIPGRCTDSLSIGCNKLMRQGAGVALAPEDILEDMGWFAKTKEGNNGKEKNNQKKDTNLTICVSDIAKEILEVIGYDPMTQDDVIRELRMRKCEAAVPLILQGLLELEMVGMVRRNSGQYILNKL